MQKTALGAPVSDYYKELERSLQSIYEGNEAATIARFVLEDAFNVNAPTTSKRIFDAKERNRFFDVQAQLLKRRPWQYVVGTADFLRFKLNVDENVLIPRPETEQLVYLITERHKNEALNVLDIGTGSGCIALALKDKLEQATVKGIDKSEGAIKIAAQNAQKYKLDVAFQTMDILDNEATKKMPSYDLIVSNPPYIQHSEEHLMPPHVLEYEPSMALFVTNNDPLQFYKIIVAFALEHLHSKGWLYFEINEFFGKEVLNLVEKNGFVNCELMEDLFGRDRMVVAQLQ